MRNNLAVLYPLLLLLGGACGLSPDQVSADIRRLNSLVTQANGRHKQTCTPPPEQVGFRPVKPAVCDPLLDCMRLATRASEYGERELGCQKQGVLRNCTAFEAERDAAFTLCRGLGIRPDKDHGVALPKRGGAPAPAAASDAPLPAAGPPPADAAPPAVLTPEVPHAG